MLSRGWRGLLEATCLSALLVPLACRERSSVGPQRSASVKDEPEGPRADLYTTLGAKRLLSAVRSRAGADCALLELELLPDRATVQLQASARPGQVEQYEWRADRLEGPVPVELRGRGSLEQNLFPLAGLELGGMSELVAQAVERVDAENGRVRRILVRRNLPADDAVGVRVYVDSPIRSGYVDADASGTLLEAMHR